MSYPVAYLGSSCRYVANEDPKFIPPSHHKQRPLFIRKAYNYAGARKVYAWEGFSFYREGANRKRRFNKHRAKSMQAGVLCMIHHLNIASGLIESSCEQMADLCQVSTFSKAGNKSITRFTRMINDLEDFKVVKTQKVWDRVLGMWIPKMIEVTERFFLMIGIDPKEYEAAQKQQLGYQKRGLSLDEQEQLTLSEAKRRAKRRFIEQAFKKRKNIHTQKKAARNAKSFLKKTWDEQRSDIAVDIMKRLSPSEKQNLSLQDLKAMVSYEVGKIKNLIKDPP